MLKYIVELEREKAVSESEIALAFIDRLCYTPFEHNFTEHQHQTWLFCDLKMKQKPRICCKLVLGHKKQSQCT